MSSDSIEKAWSNRYKSFLWAIGFMSVVIIGLTPVVLLRASSISGKGPYLSTPQIVFAGLTGIAGLFAVLVAFMCAAEEPPNFLRIDEMIFGGQTITYKQRGKAVLISFISYLIALTFAVMLDGGTKISPLSSFLILNASFGSFLAMKPKTKRTVIELTLLAFLLASLIDIPREPDAKIEYHFFEGFPLFSTTIMAFVVLITVWLDWALRRGEELKIIAARYGDLDVTKALNALIIDNKLTAVFSNDIAGDPQQGTVKSGWIEYEFNGKRYTKQYTEGDQVSLP